MELSHKNTDCYFFYYSTCKKGDSCPFRHEPSALGCETMCTYWQQGTCLDEHCNFRHMELKKNRRSIPCYWETQPGGCRKPHCSFLHKNARTITSDPINPVKTSDISSKPLNQEWLNRQDDTKYDGSSTESDQGRGSSEAGSFIGSPAVDPLIVKFEEESDNESVSTPAKPQPTVPYCKTYEQIRLEEIQAESAAYYSYRADDYQGDVGGGKIRTVTRASRKVSLYPKISNEKPEENAAGMDFQVLSLEEIRRRKRRKAARDNSPPEITLKPANPTEDTDKDEPSGDFLKNAIKTLAELRATTASRGVKRSIGECHEQGPTERRRVKFRTAEHTTGSPLKVPPVRLRRSPKRFASAADELGAYRGLENNLACPNRDDLLEAHNTVHLGNPSERLDDCLEHADAKGPAEASNTARKREVEVRLCDSSTDEDQTLVDTSPRKEERQSVSTDSMVDAKGVHVYDSLLNSNDDDYLMLDTASDDILKDIDALLKDKSTV